MSLGIQRASVTGMLAATAFLSATFFGAAPAAQADELQIHVTIAVRIAVAQIAAAFEKRTGNTVKMTVAAPGEIVTALRDGAHADVVVLTDGGLAQLENAGLVRRDRVPLATSGFGLATRSGDNVPDISTPDALKTVLLGASRVIYNDPKTSPSGQVLLRVAERLGISEQVKAKSQVVPGGASVTTLAKDTSPGFAVALSPMTEIPDHPGTRLLGPLPKELQERISFSAAPGVHPRDEALAKAFLDALASAEAKQAYVATGFSVDK